MKKLILFIFLISCTSTSSNNLNKKNIVELDFTKNLTFSEFKSLLTKYNDITDYPNIDK